jgi:gliding motility-associated-like protein
MMKDGYLRWEDQGEFYHNIGSWQGFRNDSFSQSSCGYFNTDFFYPARKCNRVFSAGGSDAQSANDYRDYLHLDKINKGCAAMYWGFHGQNISKSFMFNKLEMPVKKGVKYTFRIKVFTGAWAGLMPSDTFFNLVPVGMALSKKDPDALYEGSSLFKLKNQTQSHPAGFVSEGYEKYHLDDLPLHPVWTCSGKSSNADNYREFEFSFVADDDYEWMVIGTFKDEATIRKFSSYRGDLTDVTLSCYIDDVSLTPEFEMPVVSDNFLCRDQPLCVNAGIAAPVDWVDPFGNTVATGDSICINHPAAGIWTAVNGPLRANFTVDVFTPADAAFVWDLTTCEGMTVVLNSSGTALPGIQYTWDNGIKGHQLKTDQPGKYVLNMSSKGCTDKVEFSLKVQPKPLFSILKHDTFCGPSAGETILAAAPTNLLYEWSPVGRFIDELERGYSHSGEVHVKAVDKNGCENSESFSVIDECDPEVFIPTAFSPDANNLNESFKAAGTGFICLQMRIYNRWGQMIFDSPAQGWDGRCGVQPCPAGQYFYQMEFSNAAGNRMIFRKGVVTLMR